MTPDKPEGRRRVGLAQRRIAAKIVDRVINAGKSLDEQLDPAHGEPRLLHMPPRDRAFVKALTTTTFRRLGSIRTVLSKALDKGMPKRSGIFEPVMLTAAAQVLFFETADHAAVDQAHMLLSEDRHAKRYAGLGNAVLRRLSRERDALLEDLTPRDNLPEWLAARWTRHWGEDRASAIATSIAAEPPLDLTAKDPVKTAELTGGTVLGGNTVRLAAQGLIEKIPGYETGDWWVQDASAAMPATLLRFADGDNVADLCAAPGGKTAQICARGAKVTAYDRSASRLARLTENLSRLDFRAKTQQADILKLDAAPLYDAILLDVPCSATGTIRRHPDIAIHRNEEEIASLVAVQSAMLDKACAMLKTGGSLVYATCSLEPEEGEAQVEDFLTRHPEMARDAVTPDEVGPFAGHINDQGDLRIFPDCLPSPDPKMAGADGFFAARFVKITE